MQSPCIDQTAPRSHILQIQCAYILRWLNSRIDTKLVSIVCSFRCFLLFLCRAFLRHSLANLGFSLPFVHSSRAGAGATNWCWMALSLTSIWRVRCWWFHSSSTSCRAFCLFRSNSAQIGNRFSQSADGDGALLDSCSRCWHCCDPWNTLWRRLENSSSNGSAHRWPRKGPFFTCVP